MKIEDYLASLPKKNKLSKVKLKILKRLWGDDEVPFPKPWVSSLDLLELTGQKYFDRRTRELRDQIGCDIESAYQSEFSGHGWRLVSSELAPPQDREYLTKSQKDQLFEANGFKCSTCGITVKAGIRGLQADHKVPISRGGTNEIDNWQPMCNNCNVGKRRACEDCEIDCKTCSWAYPEIVGVSTMISINEKILRRMESYSSSTGTTRNRVMEDALKYYLDKKN